MDYGKPGPPIHLDTLPRYGLSWVLLAESPTKSLTKYARTLPGHTRLRDGANYGGGRTYYPNGYEAGVSADGRADEEWGNAGEGATSAMPAHMVGVGGEDDEISEGVVEGITIFVVDDVMGEEGEAEVADGVAGDMLALAVLEVVGVMDSGVVAGGGAVVVEVGTALHAENGHGGAAMIAGDIAAGGGFGGIAAMATEESTGAGPGDGEAAGEGAGGFEAGIPGGEEIGGLSWGEVGHGGFLRWGPYGMSPGDSPRRTQRRFVLVWLR